MAFSQSNDTEKQCADIINKTDILSEEIISKKINKKYNIIIFDKIDSTNNYAKNTNNSDLKIPTIIIANEQTSGRGRVGKTFFSPKDTGLYMSIVFSPEKKINELDLLTITAAVSVCEAIINTTSLPAKIKWVNDIFIENKKICGILTEAVNNYQTGKVDKLIIGIGVNVNNPHNEFPENIADTASAINSPNTDRNNLCAEIVNLFDKYYSENNREKIIEKYKKYSLVINKRIKYTKNNKEYYAIVKNINNSGNLEVINDDNTEETLKSGEISIIPIVE